MAERITNLNEVYYGKEPELSSFPTDRESQEFDATLTQTISWYRKNSTPEQCKEWLLEYLLEANMNDDDIASVNTMPAAAFTNVGPIARLYCRGLVDSDYINKKLSTAIEALLTLYINNGSAARTPSEEDKEVVAAMKSAKADAKLSALIASVNEAIDEFILSGYKSVKFDINDWVKVNKPSPAHLLEIKTFFEPLLRELQESYDDPELREAYSHLSKPEKNRFCDLLGSIVGARRTYEKHKERKPREKKIVPQEKIIAKVKHCEVDESLNIKSRKPASVLDASFVLTYNVKYRIVNCLVAKPGEKLTIKGTTILNFNEKTSEARRIRKPEITIPQLLKGNEKSCKNVLGSLTTQGIPATGRLNEDVLILRCI